MEESAPPARKPKKYKRKKRGQTARKKKKPTTPRWEPDFRSPASYFLSQDNDVLRPINKPKGDDPLPKKIPIGPGLSHLEAVQIMMATMKLRVQNYERDQYNSKLAAEAAAAEAALLELETGSSSSTTFSSNNRPTKPTKPTMDIDIFAAPVRRGSSAYASALNVHKAVADFEETKHQNEKNKTTDVGENNALYLSGLTWGEMTEKRQRERKYHEVYPSNKLKISTDPGLSEADGLRGWVNVMERPDIRWTIEGQKEGRKTHLKKKAHLPMIMSRSIRSFASNIHDTNPILMKAKQKRQRKEQKEKLRLDILNVARSSISLISTWARYRATYRHLLPTFNEYFKQPPQDDLYHVNDVIMVHQKATNMWVTGLIIEIDGFDPDAEKIQVVLHAHHEKHHQDNTTKKEGDDEGDEDHKRMGTEDIDSDSDEEGRGHGQKRTAHELEDDEHQAKVLVRFKNCDRSKDNNVWIECGKGRLRRQLSMDPKICDNLHTDVPLLRPRRVGGLPRKGDKVVVAIVDHHCGELYTKLGLLPIGECVDARHYTDSCKIKVENAVLGKSWVAWYNNADVQIVTKDWFDSLDSEWKRMSDHVPRRVVDSDDDEEEMEENVFRM